MAEPRAIGPGPSGCPAATQRLAVDPRRAASPGAGSKPKSREERRFGRPDRNKDGRIQGEEVLGPRRKAFAELDANGNGSLQFEEWAAKTIQKFQGADKDRFGWLTPAEYATTAPPPPKKQRCAC